MSEQPQTVIVIYRFLPFDKVKKVLICMKSTYLSVPQGMCEIGWVLSEIQVLI